MIRPKHLLANWSSSRLPQAGRSNRQAAALIEFAVMFPFLVWLIFGVWETGRLLHLSQFVNTATREGARYASTALATSSSDTSAIPGRQTFEVQKAVRAFIQNAGYPVTQVTVRVENLTQGTSAQLGGAGSDSPVDPTTKANRFDELRVTTTFPYAASRLSPLAVIVPSNTIITSVARWRCMRDEPLEVDPSIPGIPQ